MKQKKPNKSSTNSKKILEDEKDVVAKRYGYSCFKTCTNPQEKAQITIIAKKNLGYPI